jgi:hypothetical protein
MLFMKSKRSLNFAVTGLAFLAMSLGIQRSDALPKTKDKSSAVNSSGTASRTLSGLRSVTPAQRKAAAERAVAVRAAAAQYMTLVKPQSVLPAI